MAEETPAPDTSIRINVPLPRSVKYRLEDAAFILRVPEQQLVAQAVHAYLDALAKQRGEKYARAVEVLKEARDENGD